MNHRKYLLAIVTTAVLALVWVSVTAASETVPANSGFEEGQVGKAPANWRVPKISGYRVVISGENPKSGKQCVMVERTTEKPGPFGNVMQGVDAAAFRGKRIRYRAAVRTEVDGQQGRAQLWLRVDLPKEQGRRVGFFDNMHDRPINEDNWEHYEIVGDIAEDAETICLGMFLAGSGRAWLDDVSLEVVDQDAPVTGRVLGETGGMSFDSIGPGLLEIAGAMQLTHRPSLASRVTATLGMADGAKDGKQDETVDVLLPLPLAYGQQVPVTYELTVEPSEAASSVTVYQDTPHNHVAKVSVPLDKDHKKVDIKFRSLVLVGPSSFGGVPDVPYLSLTEMSDRQTKILWKGTIDSGRSCDHECKMVRRFPVKDGQWDSALEMAESRWKNWLTSEANPSDGGRLVFGLKAGVAEATSPSELIDALTP